MFCLHVWRGGGKSGRERLICLGADYPSCYPNAEVGTTLSGYFLPILIYMFFSNLKKYILKMATIF